MLIRVPGTARFPGYVFSWQCNELLDHCISAFGGFGFCIRGMYDNRIWEKACFAESYSITLVTVIVFIIVTHQPAYLMQLSGPVADHIGRRNYFFVATIVKIIGSMIEITASNFATLLLGRILAGAAIG